jgi:uncharacterized protein
VSVAPARLGLGIGWRAPLAGFIARHEDLGFVEVVAENLPLRQPLPAGLQALRERGLAVVVHGVGLSLGGVEPPEAGRVAHLARLAERLGAPLVSEHVAFVRAGGLDAGHLLPVPRTRAALGVLVANVRRVQDQLPVPLALEHVAAAVLDLLAELCARHRPPGVMLERDDRFPPEAELAAELDAIAAVVARAGARAG